MREKERERPHGTVYISGPETPFLRRAQFPAKYLALLTPHSNRLTSRDDIRYEFAPWARGITEDKNPRPCFAISFFIFFFFSSIFSFSPFFNFRRWSLYQRIKKSRGSNWASWLLLTLHDRTSVLVGGMKLLVLHTQWKETRWYKIVNEIITLVHGDKWKKETRGKICVNYQQQPSRSRWN